MIIWLVTGMVLWNACNDDDNLAPTEGLEFTYTLPQGNHDYDPKIVDWNKRCGFYILYEFQPKDLYWGQIAWLEAMKTGEVWTKSGILGEPADQAYVGEQLRLVENQLFKYYPDSTLRRFMPIKLLLCSKLEQVHLLPSAWSEDISLFSSVDMIAINYGNADIENLTAESVTAFRDVLNIEMLRRVINNDKIEIPVEFSKVSSYGEYISQRDMYSEGFIGNDSQEAKVKEDFITYLEAMITKSFEELTTETQDGNYTYDGILHSSKDVNGLIRKKYEIAADYLKSRYNVDLQRIGNER